MTLDGYNLTAEINGDFILYRPLVRSEREALGLTLRPMPEALSERLVGHQIESRIVYSTGDCSVSDMTDDAVQRLWGLTMGVGNDEQEKLDEENLDYGVYLESRYPHLARTSCEQCKAWWWNPLTGELAKQEGEAVQRPDDMELMCECSFCPKGTFERPFKFSTKNRMAYSHFKGCEASGVWPDDCIVKRNAEVINGAIQRQANDRSTIHRSERGVGTSSQHGVGRAGRATVG